MINWASVVLVLEVSGLMLRWSPKSSTSQEYLLLCKPKLGCLQPLGQFGRFHPRLTMYQLSGVLPL